MKNYLAEAIKQLKPSAQFSFTNDDYSTIKWDVLEGNAPTQSEIDDVVEQIKTEEAQAIVKTEAKKQALLDRLGITAEEAKLLLS